MQTHGLTSSVKLCQNVPCARVASKQNSIIISIIITAQHSKGDE